MAIQIDNIANTVPGSAAYPSGSGQDETVPGVSDDGTRLIASVYNDIQGLLQGFLSNENQVANDVADTVLASQYRDGLTRLVARGGDILNIADTGTMVLGNIHVPANGSGPITLDLPNTGLYAGAVVLFTAFPDEAYSVNSVTFDGNGSTIGDTATTVLLDSDDFFGGFRRDGGNTKWVPFKSVTIGTEL